MNSYSKQSKAGQAGSWLRALLALAFVTLMLLASGAARAATETITYIHPDISGSPLAATNDAGDLVWRESYRAYGQRQLNASASAQHSQWFHGKEQDAGTGLQYFGARYYDPAVGRFLGMDPVDYQDGNAHSFNRYAYGNNNPVRYLDPDGNHPVLAVGAVVFARMAVWLGTRQMAAITAAETGAMIAAGVAGPGIAGVEAVAAKAAGAAAKGAGELASAANYRTLFMQARPDLPKGWQVHHSMPQKYEELMSVAGVNIHDVQFLRGVSPQIHSKITIEWARFEKAVGGNPSATQIADFAKQLDKQYDSSFMWPGF